MKSRHSYFCAGLAALLATGASSATATILVNEPYSYGGTLSNNQTMNAVTVNSGTGLSGNYTVTVGGTQSSALFSTSSLAFSGTAASQGGSVILSSSHQVAGTDFAIMSAGLSGTMTGILYQSFLFKKTTDTYSANADALFTQLATSNTSSTGAHFVVQGESRTSGGTAVAYDSTATDATPTTGLTIDSTYLMIARYTNVGTAGGGTADLWVFDELGYANWRTAGGANEANLGTYAIRTATESSATQGNFTSNFFHLAVSEGALNTAGTIAGQFDEMRFGTTLTDVATVPEPSIGMLVLAAIGGFCIIRRRSARSI